MRIPTNITELKIKRADITYIFYFDEGMFLMVEIYPQYQCYKRDDKEAWELLKILDMED